MPYGSGYYSSKGRKPLSPKAKPQLIFTGIRLAPGFDRFNNYHLWIAPDADLQAPITILYYHTGRIVITPSRDGDSDTKQLFGTVRHGKGDRIVWQIPSGNLCIYSTLFTDVESAALRYFSPESITMLAAGHHVGANFLDMLVPYAEVVNNFCDGILGLFERGVQAKACACANPRSCAHDTILSLDAVEGDYARMQKLLALIERGATPGERESAVRRVENQLGKLYARIGGQI